MKRLLFSLFLILPLCGVASADVLTPGSSGVPDVFNLSGVTLLASDTGTWANSTNTMSGTYTAAVYSDPSNTFGAGDLDFVYQITNGPNSTDDVDRVTAITFTGYLTDVGYDSSTLAGFGAGTVAPSSVDRNTADVIGFTFGTGDLIDAGDSSYILVIETNATSYTAGFANLIDGGVTTVAAFEPTVDAATPEPSALLLLGTGALGLAGIVGRKRLTRSA